MEVYMKVLIYKINSIYTLAYARGSEKQKCIRAASESECFVNFHALLCLKAWKFIKVKSVDAVDKVNIEWTKWNRKTSF